MKILKKIGIIFLALAIIWFLVSLFLPSELRVTRGIVINAPSNLVFDQINVIRNWQHWSYWDNIDPKMESKWEGPESGVGAKHSWSSDHKDVGHGSMTIVRVVDDREMDFELMFEEMGGSIGEWRLRDTTGGTYATVSMSMNVGFLGRVFPGLVMDSWLGSDFEKTLAGLKKHSESLAAAPPAPAAMVAEDGTISETHYVSIRVKATEQNIGADMGATYQKLTDYIIRNKLEMTGTVFAFFHAYDPASVDMECAIPVNRKSDGEGEIRSGLLPAGNAVVVKFTGDYMKTPAAHEAALAYISTHKKEITGPPYEVYITDPSTEKDTSKWRTDIIYPVK